MLCWLLYFAGEEKTKLYYHLGISFISKSIKKGLVTLSVLETKSYFSFTALETKTEETSISNQALQF